MRDAFLAIEASTDLRAHARALRRTWEAALSGVAPRLPARPVIAQSWSRVAGAGADPERLHPRRALDAGELAEVRGASPLGELLPVLRHCLGALAHDAQHVLVVADETGRILWIEGSSRVRHRADGITFTEGMLWTEDSAGTNAIGTALAIDHAVQIFSAEHFLPQQHAWWCSAAPIHDPATGRLLGVVDLSGPLSTAHPHSLALVMAAADRAEDALRLQRAREDDRLRQAYLERAAGTAGRASALLAADGRVLLAHPAGWLQGRIDPHPQGGTITLPDGRVVVAESLEDGAGWTLHDLGREAAPARARPALRLELLGRHPLTARLGAGAPLELGLRHAEILALLALHREGLTGEELTLALYGERGNPISTRAEMSRLRRLLGPALAGKPYRLVADVSADFLDVERHVDAGRLDEALRAYRGPLLVASDVPRIRQARDELEEALRQAALAGSLDQLWSWLQHEPGRDDPPAITEFVCRAPADDPRQPLMAARLHSLQARWDLDGASAPAGPRRRA